MQIYRTVIALVYCVGAKFVFVIVREASGDDVFVNEVRRKIFAPKVVRLRSDCLCVLKLHLMSMFMKQRRVG